MPRGYQGPTDKTLERAKLEVAVFSTLAPKIKAADGDSLLQLKALTEALIELGELKFAVTAAATRLPYEHARKEAALPAPTGIVSDEPEPWNEEVFCERHGVER